MSLFGSISIDDFIHQYWQKKTLLTPQAFKGLESLIDGDELAGLACEEAVESRIISGFNIDGEWHCQHGPFSEETFAALGKENWTLLVQGVDQWDENIRAILESFTFLPKWRLEDIMVSYAPVGGGVGPHFDYYDVYLIQVSGKRKWHIGSECDEKTVLQNNTDVKLLSEFSIKETHHVNPGDMLYVPAGTAHWGTALTNDCITFSVGFRAPSEKDIIGEALENLMQQLSENNRYQDTEDSIDKNSNKINACAQNNVDKLLQQVTTEKLQHAIQQAFGQLVTDIRYPIHEQTESNWSVEMIQARIKSQGVLQLQHYAHSRFAYNENTLFVNGEAYPADENFSRMVCDALINTPISQEQTGLLLKLLEADYLAIN